MTAGAPPRDAAGGPAGRLAGQLSKARPAAAPWLPDRVPVGMLAGVAGCKLAWRALSGAASEPGNGIASSVWSVRGAQDGVFCETPPMAEVRDGYVTARTSIRPSWMRVW